MERMRKMRKMRKSNQNIYTQTKEPKQRAARRVWKAIKANGFTKFKLWYEPVGPALEMAGHTGGWMMIATVGAGAESQWPLGYSAEQAATEVSKLSPRPQPSNPLPK